MIEPKMTIGESDRVPGANRFGGAIRYDIADFSRSQGMRYSAELTEEMSRLAQKHKYALVALYLSVLAQKARQEMIDRRCISSTSNRKEACRRN